MIRRHGPVFLFFFVFFTIGIVAFNDFGIAWDEIHNRDFGKVAYARVVDGPQSNWNEHAIIHGAFFEVILIGLEKIFHLTDSRQIFLLRHAVTFFLFFLGVLVFYRLAGFYLAGRWGPLAACAVLVLSPRIFAHGFYNSVDIGAMTFHIFAFTSMLWFFEKPTFGRALIHGFVSAAAVDTRLTAIMIPILTWLGFDPRFSYSIQNDEDRPRLAQFLAYTCMFIVFTYIFWPYVWDIPISEIGSVFAQTFGFQREWPGLYWGNFLTKTPWHYNLVWIAISTPISYLIFFVVGFAFRLVYALRSDTSVAVRSKDWALAGWFVVPLAAPLLFKTTLYNDWRHHYFIYPPFVLFAVMGAWMLGRFFWERRRWIMVGVFFAVAIELQDVARFMIRNHPYQFVYFNSLVGGVRSASRYFEMDYWGLSCRKILESIAESDKRNHIAIGSVYPPPFFNRNILKEKDRGRFLFDSKRIHDYLIVHNFTPVDAPDSAVWEAAFSVNVEGVPLAMCYRRKRPTGGQSDPGQPPSVPIDRGT